MSRVTEVRPCGGYLKGSDFADFLSRLNATRAPISSMYPGEFLAIIQRHRHSRFSSCGIACTRFGARAREEAGFKPHGTVWFATQYEQESLFPIPCNSIPYVSLREKVWNEEKGRWGSDGEMTRGWRSALAELLKGGYLRPSDELTYLVGEDSFKLCPRKYRS